MKFVVFISITLLTFCTCTLLGFNNEDQGKLAFLESKADSLYQSSFLTEANDIYFDLLEQYEADKEKYLKILLKIGYCYYYIPDYRLAAEYADRGILSLKNTSHNYLLSKMYYLKANIYGSQAFHYEAIECFLLYLDLNHHVKHLYARKFYNAYTRILGHFRSVGHLDKAMRYSDILVEMIDRDSVVTDKRIAGVYITRASILRVMADYANALEYVNKSLSIFRKDLDNNISIIADALLLRGAIHDSKREFRKAILDFKEALELQNKLELKYNPKLSFYYYGLGTSLFNSKEYTKATENFIRSYELDKENFGEDHYYVAWNELALAGAYTLQFKYDTADYYYRKALPVLQRSLNKNHSLFTEYYQSRADYYFWNNEKEEALSNVQKAIQSISANFEVDNYYANPTLNQIPISEYVLAVLNQKANFLYTFYKREHN